MRALTNTMVLAGALLWSSTASAGEPTAIPDTDKTDYFIVYASHAEAKPTDPVTVRFEKIKVNKVAFKQPVAKGLKGATAQFEIDLASLKSDAEKRDAHLKSPDYLDTAKFATAKVDVSGVKAAEGADSYTAKAKLSFRGKTYDWKVNFKVVEKLADGVRIRAEHKLTRKEIGVGKEAGDGTGQDLMVRLQLTLKSAPKAASK
ncbi:MAG TPA: YceI family protein [Kofleriaceae bacterium]|nr:YceI family protein [Kofleriaceae bacterium]